MVSKNTLTPLLGDTFDGLSDESRVWIWQSDRQLTPEESITAEKHLREFTNQWVSHNRALVAKSAIILNRFWVIVLDQSAGAGASGCSIDSLTHAVQNIAGVLNVNVLDRTQFCFYRQDEVAAFAMNDLSKAIADELLSEEDLVFDNLIKTKKDLLSTWLKPLSSSWHHRFV